jgi:heme oxygenase
MALPEETQDVPNSPAATASSRTEEGLADRLWRETSALHAEAERTGFVNAILRQRATREGYALFLRNLYPVYQTLETALEGQASGPLRALVRSEVFRTDALRSDLSVLHGPTWQQDLPLVASAASYASRIAACAARHEGIGLGGHAYTRYLGDLNGGQIVARLLARSLGLSAGELAFYAFPQIKNIEQFARTYRAGIDGLGTLPDVAPIGEEARAGFASSIALSLEVADLVLEL